MLTCAFGLGHTFSDDYIEALLAAALFHDIGLTRITDERHGAEGAEIVKQYVASNPDVRLKLTDELVEAIRIHDIKEASAISNPFDLAAVLTTCDNLDAFGYVGVYRYAEIYLIRGVELGKVAALSLENMKKRFSSFEQHYALLSAFFDEQKQRYLTACSVFTDDKAMVELLEAIECFGISEKKDILSVADIYSKKSHLLYWDRLKEDLSAFITSKF